MLKIPNYSLRNQNYVNLNKNVNLSQKRNDINFKQAKLNKQTSEILEDALLRVLQSFITIGVLIRNIAALPGNFIIHKKMDKITKLVNKLSSDKKLSKEDADKIFDEILNKLDKYPAGEEGIRTKMQPERKRIAINIIEDWKEKYEHFDKYNNNHAGDFIVNRVLNKNYDICREYRNNAYSIMNHYYE